jgi:signal transduction histidine kinase
MVELLNEFRSLTVAQRLNLELTDLEKLIHEILFLEKLAYRPAGIMVKLEFEKPLPMVNLDASKMKQAVLNLCKNAVEAMTNGGCLTIRAHRVGAMVALAIAR